MRGDDAQRLRETTRVVIAAAPVILLVGVVLIGGISSEVRDVKRRQKIGIARLRCGMFAALVAVGFLALALAKERDAFVCSCLTALSGIIAMMAVRTKGSTAAARLFWSSLAIGTVVRFAIDPRWRLRELEAPSAFLISIFGLGTEFLQEGRPKEPVSSVPDECPPTSIFPPPFESGVSLINFLTYEFISPFISLGSKRSLIESDFCDLLPTEKTHILGQRFSKLWRREETARATDARIWIVILRFLSRISVEIFILKILTDTLNFVGPHLLERIVQFIATWKSENPEPAYFGYSLVAAMILKEAVISLVRQQYGQKHLKASMRLRSALVSSIYQKALRMAPATTGGREVSDDGQQLATSTSGEIVNLMSMDAQKVADIVNFMSQLVAMPYQLILTLYFLWRQLGSAAWLGALSMILIIPIQASIAASVRRTRLTLVEAKDKRAKLVNEILSGIRIIKLYAWETSFIKKLTNIRIKELDLAWKFQKCCLAGGIHWGLIPIGLTASSFICYELKGHHLDAATAFTSIALMNILRAPMSLMAHAVPALAEARVSAQRIKAFLQSPEVPSVQSSQNLEETARVGVSGEHSSASRGSIDASSGGMGKERHVESNPPAAVCLRNVCFRRATDGEAALSNLSFQCHPGALTLIAGRIGAGKSTLLSGIMGDLRSTEGTLQLFGSLAYVAQVPWIQNGTVRYNILFGKEFDSDRYKETLIACALMDDLDVLPAGDETEIGERGVNLSGGQKQRIAIARAVYQNSDVYLFDDCFSAVDAVVGEHIFTSCIQGMLASKTVILVTHRPILFSRADQILFIKDKTVAFGGTYEEVKDVPAFVDFAVEERTDEEISSPSAASDASTEAATPTPSEAGSGKPPLLSEASAETRTKMGTLTQEEVVREGPISRDVYLRYIASIGGFPPALLIAGIWGISFSLLVGSNAWLSYWTESSHTMTTRMGLAIYVLILFLQVTIWASGYVTLCKATRKSAFYFHERLSLRIFRAPMHFFDSTPLGRILNRFTRDLNVIDEAVPGNLVGYLGAVYTIGSAMCVVCFATPTFSLFLLPLIFLYKRLENYFVATSRQIQRLQGIIRSPVFQHFSESLMGVETIRAFKAEERFHTRNEELLDRESRVAYCNILVNRWLAVRLEVTGALVAGFAALLAVMSRGIMAPGLAGIAIAYSLQITGSWNGMVRVASDMETNTVSVERVSDYLTNCPQEAPPHSPPDAAPHPSWPDRGAVEFHNVAVRYRPDLRFALRSVNLKFAAGEKVGIVGRTGAGKSTVFLTLLRLVEPTEGNIFVDGIDISSIGLEDLRSRFAIIPQDPVLFGGSLRFNLDPCETSTDGEILDALRRSHILDFVREELPFGLDSTIEEGGKNVSMGQRQLFCLARALLRKSRVLLLDEATSAVDPITDSLIQDTIRTEFDKCTVLTIAHRINTILDYDKVISMHEGTVVEEGTPSHLKSIKGGVFWSLCAESGLV